VFRVIADTERKCVGNGRKRFDHRFSSRRGTDGCCRIMRPVRAITLLMRIEQLATSRIEIQG
jgi:hypothetical protein